MLFGLLKEKEIWAKGRGYDYDGAMIYRENADGRCMIYILQDAISFSTMQLHTLNFLVYL